MKTLISTLFMLSLVGCTSSDPEPVNPSNESIEHFRVLGTADNSDYSGDEPENFKVDSCLISQEWGTTGIFKIVTADKQVVPDAETYCGPDWKYSRGIVWFYELQLVEKILGEDIPKLIKVIGVNSLSSTNPGDFNLMTIISVDEKYYVKRVGFEIDPASKGVVHESATTIVFPSTVTALRAECEDVLARKPKECLAGEKRWPTLSETEAAVRHHFYDRGYAESNCENAMDPVDDPDP